MGATIVVRWAWKIKIFTHLDLELKMKLKEAAEEEAIKVFASNLKDLLLAAPAGPRATLGLDPGLRAESQADVVIDRNAVMAALENHGGTVARAARSLGISRQALYRRMEKFGIPRT